MYSIGPADSISLNILIFESSLIDFAFSLIEVTNEASL